MMVKGINQLLKNIDRVNNQSNLVEIGNDSVLGLENTITSPKNDFVKNTITFKNKIQSVNSGRILILKNKKNSPFSLFS